MSSKDCRVTRSLECLLTEDLHHPPLDVSITINTSQSENFPCNSTEIYNFKKADFPQLYELLFKIDWSFLNELTDVNNACSEFYSKLNDIFDKTVPKYVPKQPKYPPWYTNNIVRDIKKKGILWKKYKQTKNNNIYREFSDIRKKIKDELKQAHENYLLKIQDNIKNDPKKFGLTLTARDGTVLFPIILHITIFNVQIPKILLMPLLPSFKLPI